MYTALYRKWRPLTFDDVISQPHTVTALKNQICSKRTAHAYLFTGSRGTGKTTCARIFAKAINCKNQKDGNPCLECEICKNADMSALTDIIEIDAASNNGVDDIRDLRDNVLYTPEQCDYKIYIIDEVHMLSASAFNALLKIMEEPPSYVKFILATTEIHKVPQTILSRCQRFDFRRILSDDIAARLMYISSQENLNLKQDAADLIAKLADGGMRDAVSLLDQCSAFGDEITSEIVSSVSGAADRKFVFDIVTSVIRNTPADALSVINELHSMSKDMQRLCDEITMQFRNIMLIKSGITDMSILSCMPHEFDILKTLAAETDLSATLERLKIMQDCSSRLARAINKRTELEMCTIRLCSPHTIQQTVVQTIQQPVIPQKAEKSEPAKPVSIEMPAANPEPVPPSKIRQEDFKPLKNWADIMNEYAKTSPAVVGTLANSSAYINNVANLILIVAENPFFLTLFKSNPEYKKSLQQVVMNMLGKNYTISAKCNNTQPSDKQKDAVKLIEKANGNGIETEAVN